MTRLDIELAQHMAADLNRLLEIQPQDILTNVDAYLRSCDASLGTYGLEYIADEGQRPLLAYCNAGDPYHATLIFDYQDNTFLVACWGDIVEERDYQ